MFGTTTFNGIEYTLTSNADFEYRSHKDGWQCNEPNNWLSAAAIDPQGNPCKVWWFVTDEQMQDINEFGMDYYDYDNATEVEHA